MKRHGNLFKDMFTEERLYQAYYNARKGKRKKRAVLEFERDLGHNISTLSEEVKSGTYEITQYNPFTIYEPKERTIYAPAFRDIVVQHDIYEVIYPIFNSTFIDQSYACRRGMGTHSAAWRAYKMLCHTKDSYYLKMDIKKFFYSINRDILGSMFVTKIKDRFLLKLMNRFAVYLRSVGIPIGNLLSQLYALIYLNPLDHFIKRTMKMTHYVRYADDFVIFGQTKKACKEHLHVIRDYLKTNLDLELSKWSIKKAQDGINYVGYRMWPGKRLVRKRSLSNFNKAVRKGNIEAIVSILGHAKRTNTLMHMLKTLRYNHYYLINKLPQNYLRLALEV